MNDATDAALAARQQAQETGMVWALHASAAPDRPAVISEAGNRSFAQLNARCNQLARLLRKLGIGADEGVAMLCANRPEFVEIMGGCARSGVRITPINWHLTGAEVGYIVNDCEAKLFIADARFADGAQAAAALAPAATKRLAIGGAIPGFDDYDQSLAAFDDSDVSDPVAGRSMLYTSGTTGNPKGVYRREPTPPTLLDALAETAKFDPESDLALVTGPLYHAAPLLLNMQFPMAYGVGLLLMDRWDAEQTLALIARHRATHTHVVPTMFHRILRLPDDVKQRYDVSSMRWILHGAAPCPVDTKQQIIDWLGPVVYEYYAATEGGGLLIDSHEWQQKPGSVGRPDADLEMTILDEAMAPVADGDIGTVYFRAPEVGRFEYFKSPEKTASAYHGDFYTMGDKGYVDADGFLFLTGRSAEQIIAGGVNIYPAEIDAVLLNHPDVHDVATIGVPNEEWGEEVKAVVQAVDGVTADAKLAETLIAFCREHLAHYKCPRSIDFATDLPRLPTGKILRREVRAPYWRDREKSI